MSKRLCLGLLGLGLSGVLTANPIVVEPDHRIDASIALNQLNRIKVVEDRITQVFGDENTFSLETDEENGQIFVKPQQDNPLFLTLVTENGESIDLSLTPSDIEAQTLVLKVNSNSQKTTPEKESAVTERIVDLMMAMHQGEALNGFTRFNSPKHETLGPFILDLQEVYHSDTLKGEIWQVKNSGNETQTLTEKMFLQEPTIAAIALKTLSLAPNDSTQLFKVKHHE